jgi:hypothetical protein
MGPAEGQHQEAALHLSLTFRTSRPRFLGI